MSNLRLLTPLQATQLCKFLPTWALCLLIDNHLDRRYRIKAIGFCLACRPYPAPSHLINKNQARSHQHPSFIYKFLLWDSFLNTVLVMSHIPLFGTHKTMTKRQLRDYVVARNRDIFESSPSRQPVAEALLSIPSWPAQTDISRWWSLGRRWERQIDMASSRWQDFLLSSFGCHNKWTICDSQPLPLFHPQRDQHNYQNTLFILKVNCLHSCVIQ